MTVQATSNSLERELEYRKKLTAIANQINSAESIPHILMTLKDKILELLDAERLTIYAIDTKNQELYSLQKIGDVPVVSVLEVFGCRHRTPIVAVLQH